MSEIWSDGLGLVGRLHPALVHLPIGFIIFLALIEVLARWPRFQGAAGARRLLLPLCVFSVAVSAGCGWVLSWNGEYEEATLGWHKWLGTALVPMMALLQALLVRGAAKTYRIGLGLTVILLVFTGHYGSALVRGAGYLFGKSGTPSVADQMAGAASSGQGGNSAPTAFNAVVQPIFNQYCILCHGPEKAKGKLRLDTAAHLFQGGESGPVIQPGAATRSPLVKRLRLPPSEDDHMPPEGKKQPGPRDIALLEWWINVGAPLDKTINELKMP